MPFFNWVVALATNQFLKYPFYLVNTRMRSKRDIKKGGLYTLGWGGGCSPRNCSRNCRWSVALVFVSNLDAISDQNMPFFIRYYALVVLLKAIPAFRL